MAIIPKDPFILVDGSSYFFRAYHALPPLMTSKGKPTGAIYGVINMLRKLFKDYHPRHIAVVFDSKEKNFRHQLYTPYKANRLVMPEELQEQVEPLFALITAMGFPLVVLLGIEADDIIGSLAVQARKKGWFSLISTGDKDFVQLVDDKLYLINTMSQVIYDRKQVIEKFEVTPEQMVDYLTLVGDSVDNIPGVPKVGPKTAVKWLEQYGSLEAIISHAADIPGKVGENLREALPHLSLFRQLVTIDTTLSLPLKLEDLIPKAPDNARLRELLSEFEFKTWLRDLNEKTPPEAGADLGTPTPSVPVQSAPPTFKKGHYETIFTESAFERWLEKLKQAPYFAFDTETTSLDYMAAEIVGFSFSVSEGEACYIPLMHDYLGAEPQLDFKWALKKLKPILENDKILKIGHNLKYDSEVLANHDIELKGMKFDTMLESYVLDSVSSRHDMNTLAEKHLHHRTIHFEDVAGKGAKQLSFNQVTIDKAAEYAAEDADVTLRLHDILWPRLEQEKSIKEVFLNIEMPLVSVLSKMERRGVLIDVKRLKQQSEELGQKLEGLQHQVFSFVGKSFNLNSPKQLQEILYEDLKLPILEKTPTGQPSTSESVLQELALKFDLPKLILEFRSLSKLKSTYTDSLPEQLDPKTGRIHTSYHQAVTSTGRLSSSNPNLQNIPIRTPEGRKIRTAFIAPPHHKIVAADYSQIELRIMAHLSNDPNLVQAFTQDDDVHRSTASAVFGVPLDKVTSEQRRSAKIINFGLLYGMSAFGLSKQLGLSREEAEHQVTRYFTCFPGVKKFIADILRTAQDQGYVETLFGRRLYLPELKSRNRMLQKATERAAINAPMQGTNADIIKLAMIELDKWFEETQIGANMIMQVHDELVFEVPEKVLDEVIEKIRSTMENRVDLAVKLRVGIGVGNNWDEAHG